MFRFRISRLFAPALAVCALSCTALLPLRQLPPETPPEAQAVAALLSADWPANPVTQPLPEISEPTVLRPCCAFGLELEVDIGALPVPGFSLETVRGAEDIGPHDYAAGLLQVSGSSVDAGSDRPASENNGIVYTCRGGFVDTAHTRDYADLTFYLASRIAKQLGSAATIELAEQGGNRRVRLSPLDAASIEQAGRFPLAVALAQHATFQLSVWREIATWYGHESVPPWPEKISSFSLEDLYSNQLGTRIASAILLQRGVRDEADWDRAMTAWFAATLRELGLVPKDSAAAAMRAVDGLWWDSKKRVPDWKLTLRRQFDLAPILPLLVDAARVPGCEADPPPQELLPRRSFAGTDLTGVVRVELEVSDKLAEEGFPFPRRGDRIVSDADFPPIIEALRKDTIVKRRIEEAEEAREED